MKFSTNIIVVIVVTIVLVLLYKYWYRTTEHFSTLSYNNIRKKALNYIGYSNIYMREINKVNNIKDLHALRISHNKLIENTFIIKNPWSLFGKRGIFINILSMRGMTDHNFSRWVKEYNPEKVTNLKRLLKTVILRLNKINKMIDDKLEGRTRPVIKGPAMGTFKFL